jgi:hypothetical protein
MVDEFSNDQESSDENDEVPKVIIDNSNRLINLFEQIVYRTEVKQEYARNINLGLRYLRKVMITPTLMRVTQGNFQ